MSKVIEKNVAEIIVLTVLTIVLMSSCGSIKLGDYDRYKQVNSTRTCR